MDRLHARIFMTGLLAAGWIFGGGQVARAQQATSAATAAPNAATRQVTDVFMGRNVVGPYLLSWKLLEPGSVIVTRGARRLSADSDYRVDVSSGTLTFTAPLKTREIARADYLCTDRAAPNTVAPALPLQFNLFERGKGALTLNALYRPETGAPSGTVSGFGGGLMLLGFNGNARLESQSTLTSKFYLDARGGSVLDRSAMQLSEKSKTRYGQFSVGFTRGGSGFAGSEETGIATGRQVIEAAGSLNAIHGIQASASFSQTTDLPQEGRGATVTTLGQRLAGILAGSMRFQASRTETTTDIGDGDPSNRVVSRLQLDQKIGAFTQATAVLDHTENAAGDSRSVAQTGTLTVRSQPNDRLSLQGSVQNRLLPSGPEDATSLRVEADATKQVKLSALVGDRYSQKGALRSREASVQYTPRGTLSLTGSLISRSDAGNESLAGGFGATARPTPYLEISGGVRLREEIVQGVADPNAPDTYNLKLSLRLPGNFASLTGGIADNPEDDRGSVTRARNRSLSLQSHLGQFELAGGYTYQDEYLSPRINTILDLRFGWQFARGTQIVTAYRAEQTLAEGLLLADTYSLSLTHRVGASLDLMLSGAMTTRFQNGLWQPSPDYRADARLGLRF